MTCNSIGVIYLINCQNCNAKYIGQTSRHAVIRIIEHIKDITYDRDCTIGVHFNRSCSLKDFSFSVIEKVKNTEKRLQKEVRWIHRLNTLSPTGLNVVSDYAHNKSFCILPHGKIGNILKSNIKRHRKFKVTYGYYKGVSLSRILRK